VTYKADVFYLASLGLVTYKADVFYLASLNLVTYKADVFFILPFGPCDIANILNFTVFDLSLKKITILIFDFPKSIFVGIQLSKMLTA
jgi:hypothetical protein